MSDETVDPPCQIAFSSLLDRGLISVDPKDYGRGRLVNPTMHGLKVIGHNGHRAAEI